MNQNAAEQRAKLNHKTILLIGGFEGNQSLFIRKLQGEKTNNSQFSKVDEYISNECKFNILTKKDLDDLQTDQEKQSFRDEICQKALSYAENNEAKIDVIIIMWRPRPRKNDHSRFLQIIGTLKESFGENVMKSCVFMVEGDWSKMEEKEKAKILKETQDVKREIPDAFVEKFDTRDAVEVLEKQLETIISQIEPYKVNPPQAQPQVPPQSEEEKEQESETIREVASGNKKIWSTAKYGSMLTGLGAVTGLTAIAYEEAFFVAAGAIGMTAGAALMMMAAAAGAYKGLSYVIRTKSR